MKHLKQFMLLFVFVFLSCKGLKSSKQYEPIKTYLISQQLNKTYILQQEKISNKQVLRIFNGSEGLNHVLPQTDTHAYFNLKHWKKMYLEYKNDTLPQEWKKSDFNDFKFLYESKKALFGEAFTQKIAMGTGNKEIIFLSEPLYYWNKKYVLFYYQKAFLFGGGSARIVIMKREKNHWKVEKEIGDYIYN
ncbi:MULTISPECIES: hypothetical protein [unclassified Flavobacterium]|uniref:hypothetical protein n=1 Tax=unclassified Flavobacterium TaxID=196869 RepID=UPI00131C3CAF|nr:MULTISPECIES: hypothetical protein [unclassified Flavobacterium]